jgi:hypothetical protein
MLNATLSTALNGSSIRQFVAVRIELPSHTLNLIDGSAAITFPVGGTATTFTGSDPIFGTIAAIGSVAEQMAMDSPTLSVSLFPASSNAIGELCNPVNQGAAVYVWWGIVNEATGVPVGEPELLWLGRFDTAKPNLGLGQQLVEIETVSAFDRLFAAEEGARLNGVWHRIIWAGETGLDFNIKALADVFWGMEAPAKNAVVYSNGGSGSRMGVRQQRIFD